MAEAKIAQKKPYVLKSEKTEKVLWCRCGLSENQPFCDASHKGTDFRPIVVEVEEGKTYYWCGCKQTGNPPFCDSTHTRL